MHYGAGFFRKQPALRAPWRARSPLAAGEAAWRARKWDLGNVRFTPTIPVLTLVREHRPPGPAGPDIIMPAPKLPKGKRGCMVFRDHARVGLLWLIVTCPLRALRYFPLRARPSARPSVSFCASARRPFVVPVAAAPCSQSSSRARPPHPLSAFCAPAPRSCVPRSARSRAGARPVPRCAPH